MGRRRGHIYADASPQRADARELLPTASCAVGSIPAVNQHQGCATCCGLGGKALQSGQPAWYTASINMPASQCGVAPRCIRTPCGEKVETSGSPDLLGFDLQLTLRPPRALRARCGRTQALSNHALPRLTPTHNMPKRVLRSNRCMHVRQELLHGASQCAACSQRFVTMAPSCQTLTDDGPLCDRIRR